MATLFADLPEAVENTVEIARRCAFMAYKRDPILPKFADDEVEELRRRRREGLKERLAVIPMPRRWKTTKNGWSSSWASSRAWAFPATS
jgi:DNA polymerase III alpha subunit